MCPLNKLHVAERINAVGDHAAGFGNSGASISGDPDSGLFHSGPKARKEGQKNQGMCAGREAGFFVGRPLGAGAEAPEIFWVLLYLYKSTSPGGEISPSPSRPQAIT